MRKLLFYSALIVVSAAIGYGVYFVERSIDTMRALGGEMTAAYAASIELSTTTLSHYGGTENMSEIQIDGVCEFCAGFPHKDHEIISTKCVTAAGSYDMRIGDGDSWTNTVSCTPTSTEFNPLVINNVFHAGEHRYIQVDNFSGFTSTSSIIFKMQDVNY